MSDLEHLDEELVARVLLGDKRAFDLLVRRYQQRVISLVGRYVSSPADAADIAQETFIKAYRSLALFRGDSAFYSWLYRIAVNTAKNWLTTQGRRPQGNSVDLDDTDYSSCEALHEQATPEGIALSEEIKKRVFTAIDSLPEELRMAITLRELEGLSYDEIAVVMDCPVGTVRSRIFRAREAIDKQLQPLING